MDSVELTKKTWRNLSTSQKARLLKELGHSESFAKTKTMSELVKRGGGMAARDVHKTVSLWKKRNPNTEIKW